jgi:hypothetical protein
VLVTITLPALPPPNTDVVILLTLMSPGADKITGPLLLLPFPTVVIGPVTVILAGDDRVPEDVKVVSC